MRRSVPRGFRLLDAGEASSAAWQSPLPLVGQFERVPYPIDALPSSIRAAVDEVQAAVQAPAEMVASSALAVVSLATQHLADVRRSPTLTGPIALYFLTVAESGDRKSTVDRLLSAAVRDFQDAQREAAKDTLAKHAADVVTWTAEREAIESKLNCDAKSGKSLDEHRLDLGQLETRKPESPRVPRLIYEDVTSEKLGKSLATEWPSAGIFSSEAGAVLGGHSMGKDALARTLSLLNKLWDGSSHIVDRATSAGFTVRGARMTVSLQVQPAVLADFLDRDRGLSRGSGFLARFLIAQPASLQGRRLYCEPGPLPALADFSARVSELLSDSPEIDGDRGMVLPLLDLAPDAKAAWVEAYDEIEKELATDGDFAAVRDSASKAADNIARLAAVLHVYENGPHGSIGRAAVESATAIVSWHLYNARTVLTPFTMAPDAAAAATLDGWLIDRCQSEGRESFFKANLLRVGPNRTRRAEDLDKALTVLVAHHRVRLGMNGRRQEVHVNPALLDSTADYSDSDNAVPGLPHEESQDSNQ